MLISPNLLLAIRFSVKVRLTTIPSEAYTLRNLSISFEDEVFLKIEQSALDFSMNENHFM